MDWITLGGWAILVYMACGILAANGWLTEFIEEVKGESINEIARLQALLSQKEATLQRLSQGEL